MPSVRSRAEKLPGDKAMKEVGTARSREFVRRPSYLIRDADFASESLIQILSAAFESRTGGSRTLGADAPRRFEPSSKTSRNVNRTVLRRQPVTAMPSVMRSSV